MIYFAFFDAQKAMDTARPWMNPIVTQEEYSAIEWVKKNTQERDVFVTDIFGGELLMGNTLREGTEGGDWAIIPKVVERMSDVQYKFYEAKDVKEAWETARKYGAKYAWVPDRQVFPGFAWKQVDSSKFEDEQYFRLAYYEGVKIYEVKQNVE